MRKLGLLLMAVGALLVCWSGYQWWKESRTAVYDPKTALAYTPRTHPNDPALSRGIPPYPAPRTGETFGQLVIPRIGAILPIVEGTDEDQLAKGVGHLRGSALPGVTGNAVLSGHRDTVFRRMGEVKKGDLLVVRTEAGTFTYRVQKMWVTKPTDLSVLASKPTPTLTLTTCYPFGYIGSAPDRYIVEAVLIRIDSKKNKAESHLPTFQIRAFAPVFLWNLPAMGFPRFLLLRSS
ncbi:class D sortase [Polycladomyces subterraneus]|uniref:Class D sortase n=1 Tax=Polycladomyces subterraneus TaxID=1016997 RepID=A0ABT8IME8_9BACL|nr:class D sortase [Polycladomyces subterraneus]MDN4593963.1 class D sortase [Polycladomyces subterraneus]